MKAVKVLAVILLATFAVSTVNAQKRKIHYRAHYRHHHVVRHPMPHHR